ncbi:MAG: hydrogenase nickel incorporation protein HypB [Elainella sp. Prado103]|jgi:hydrogenase nickel incorporation protein HypB|nr:hydrogenase nickel incorporation protein HypB [Elainella sp. Prado103]
MCVTCGCSDPNQTIITDLQTGNIEALPPEQFSAHTHVLADGTVVTHTHTHTHDLEQPGDHDTHTHDPEQLSDHDRKYTDAYDHAGDHHNFHHDHIGHHHEHRITYESAQIHATMHGNTIALEHKILAKNDLIAAQNRHWLKERHILALNLVSSPGSGKTTLLTRTITDLQDQVPIAVIEGDQETANDAQRIQATGCPVIQVNTGTGCHLEASMIDRGLQTLKPPMHSLLMIENVGNLVCPALFDLGEHAKVAILSVTEGEDKPIKYPHMFKASQVMILTKIDLLPYVNFEVDRCLAYARQVNPSIEIFQVSATTGEGLSDWYAWLHRALG